jgi:hypothetical protein
MPTHEILTMLAAANPVPSAPLPTSADDELCQRILLQRSPRRGSAVLSRRRVLVAAGTASIATAVAAAWWTTRSEQPTNAAYRLTPPMLELHPDGVPAAQVLAALAERARAQPVEADDRYRYTKLQWIGLDLAADSRSTTSAVRSELVERWLAGDGSGRDVWTLGDIAVVHEGDAETVKSVTFHGPPVRDERHPAGFAGVLDLGRLETDPAVLTGQLSVDRTQFILDQPYELLTAPYRALQAVLAVIKQQYVPPRLWAPMLQVVARTPGLTSQGSVVDSLGRKATAVSVILTPADYRPGAQVLRSQRLVILFDTQTGGYIGDELSYVTRLGSGPYDKYLNVKIPVVQESNTLVIAANVSSDSDRP